MPSRCYLPGCKTEPYNATSGLRCLFHTAYSAYHLGQCDLVVVDSTKRVGSKKVKMYRSVSLDDDNALTATFMKEQGIHCRFFGERDDSSSDDWRTIPVADRPVDFQALADSNDKFRLTYTSVGRKGTKDIIPIDVLYSAMSSTLSAKQRNEVLSKSFATKAYKNENARELSSKKKAAEREIRPRPRKVFTLYGADNHNLCCVDGCINSPSFGVSGMVCTGCALRDAVNISVNVKEDVLDLTIEVKASWVVPGKNKGDFHTISLNPIPNIRGKFQKGVVWDDRCWAITEEFCVVIVNAASTTDKTYTDVYGYDAIILGALSTAENCKSRMDQWIQKKRNYAEKQAEKQ
jgi:hypothetical protein